MLNCIILNYNYWVFIVALCILKSAQFSHQQMHCLLTCLEVSNVR